MSKIKFQGDSGGTGVFTIASPNSSTDRTITLPDAAGTLLDSSLASSATVGFVIDEDNFSSDSATKVPTQQSVKAYVDAQIAAENTLAEDNDVNITSAADGAMLLYDTGTSKWIDNVMSGDATMADTGVISLAANTVDSSELVDGSVDASHLASDSVITAKILDANVTTAKIADLNVTTAKIAADAITAAKIADDVINSEHIVADSIDAEHLAPNSVNTDAYIDASIQTAHITDANITTAKIADANVTLAKVASQAANTVLVKNAIVKTSLNLVFLIKSHKYF